MNDKSSTNETLPLDGKIVEDIDAVAKYDPELRFRKLSDLALKLMYAMTLILSIFHIYHFPKILLYIAPCFSSQAAFQAV